MMRIVFVCLAWFALLGASGPLAVRVDVQRASLDLLDPVSFVISVINSSARPVVAEFPTAALYDIAVTKGRQDVWRWSNGHVCAQVRHPYTFAPGRTLLGTYVWDGLAAARSLGAGDYRATIYLGDERYHPRADVPLRFALPLPIAALAKLPPNAEVTIAGTLHPEDTALDLVDPSGAVRLSRRIAMQAPGGTFVVRGFLTKASGESLLSIDRWARAFDNVEPTPAPGNTPAHLPLAAPRKTPAP
ncbi:MAG: BsuPI-related putative proteinase inhibitor [Candidatus Eremiobacteraeota bacterium]|nr:BsuPI-related putative proteinase inhibitor [Candidatus Eremiobacteraeota bacterium]